MNITFAIHAHNILKKSNHAKLQEIMNFTIKNDKLEVKLKHEK